MEYSRVDWRITGWRS